MPETPVTPEIPNAPVTPSNQASQPPQPTPKKSIFMIVAIVAIVIVGLGFVLFMVGNFIAQKAGTAITETVLEQAAGGAVDINSGNDTLNITTDEGTASFGTSATLPAGFPSDIPTPTTGTIYASSTSEYAGAQSFTVTYTLTAAQAATVGNAYKSQLEAAGYVIDTSSQATDNQSKLEYLYATKGDRTVAMSVATGENGASSIGLIVSIR